MNVAHRTFYALLASGGLASMGWGVAQAGSMGLFFGLFALLTVGGSLMCIWEPSVVRSAFCLLATFGGTAGLFLLLGADFLAMSQLLIYVGGILALILFGVMLTPPDLTERRLPRVLGGLTAFGLVGLLFAAKVAGAARWVQAAELGPPVSRTEEIGVGFLAADGYVVAFELAAVVLTVALVAAVYIARRRKEDMLPGRAEAAPLAGPSAPSLSGSRAPEGH
jgi:NADH-quinone oxidoreductase subunit J